MILETARMNGFFRKAETDPPPWLDQVRQEQVATLYRNIHLGMSATWFAALAVVALLVQQRAVSFAVASIWFGLVSALTLSRLVLAWFYERAPDARSDWSKWAAWFTTGVTSSGVVWGIGSLFLMSPDRFDLQLLIVVVWSAVVYGSLAAFGRWMPAFFGFMLPAMVPSALWSLAQGDALHIGYSVLALIWIPAMALLALRFHDGAVQALALGFENAALAEDLRRQKQVAEEANAAKTRFLAAASHDLRQPVHALGLFVGALKAEELPKPAARLVDQIDVATASLDELFTSLLDVSRLDAGVVQPQWSAVALAPMLKRLADEMRPEAERKGLSLRLRARDVAVRSDSVMLERVLRNLLSNAIRYTKLGGVLAAVRMRDGAAVIEVWDTGHGISDQERDLVFREFYRAGGKDSAGGGLGLGLAIVQRLCNLLGHPLELRSVVGRGAMFRVQAEIAAAERIAATQAATEIPGAPTGARVWVIDDELGPRAGMEALLQAWGYDVLAAQSGAEMLALFAKAPILPQAILCDYRLANEDGVALIGMLRERLGAAIPAALITGDTAPERLREAAASGLPILHKPVSKPRLRALIGNLTRAARAAS